MRIKNRKYTSDHEFVCSVEKQSNLQEILDNLESNKELKNQKKSISYTRIW